MLATINYSYFPDVLLPPLFSINSHIDCCIRFVYFNWFPKATRVGVKLQAQQHLQGHVVCAMLEKSPAYELHMNAALPHVVFHAHHLHHRVRQPGFTSEGTWACDRHKVLVKISSCGYNSRPFTKTDNAGERSSSPCCFLF